MINRLIACLTLLLAAGWANADDASSSADHERNPRSVYFTVGDNQDLLWTPLDSDASINAAFDVLANQYNVERILWRGGQDEIWGNQFVIRDHSRRYVRLWDWWKDNQYRVVNTNRIAVKAAHDCGMEIWLTYGLFDNGSQADAGFGGFTYAAEDKIRIDHPEWAPVNKYGTWRQGGPIEFAYPEARKAMVDYLAKYTIDGGYDGIAFLSYVENYTLRYEDEFGYSQPIVDEFKKRHGVDIRTQPFDRDAWAKLRGEYLTQFMRELKAALGDRKIAVSVDGKNPHLPCLWNIEGGVRTVGRLWMDIDTWVKEGIVDEINLYYPNTDEALASVMKLCEGTPAKVSVFGRTGGDIPQAGIGRVMTVGNEMESGFPWENRIDFPDEDVPPQPIDSLKSDDVYARRRILTAVDKGKQTASASDVTPLLKDPDVYVRRAALRALATIDDKSAIPAIERAMFNDAENSVRWLAAVVLGQLGAPSAVSTIFGAVAKDNSTYQFNFVVLPAIVTELQKSAKLSGDDVAHIISRTSNDNNDKTREAAWYALRMLTQTKDVNWADAALRTLREDKNQYCRELALYTLRTAPPTPEILDAVRQIARKDDDVVVQARAAAALAELAFAEGTPAETRDVVIADLVAQFRGYGAGSQRADQAWGWREVGNALLRLGEPGEAALQRIMQDEQDQQLADLAWRVIYLRQEQKFCFVTEQQDAEAHAKHPFLKFPTADPHADHDRD